MKAITIDNLAISTYSGTKYVMTGKNCMHSVLCILMAILVSLSYLQTTKAQAACVTQATLNADIGNIVAATAADVAASIALAAALAAVPFGWLAVGEAAAALTAAAAWEYSAWTTYNQDSALPLCCPNQ